MDCSVFGVQGLSCEFFGSGASNDTHMRCIGLDGVDKENDHDSSGFCLDDTTSSTTDPVTWR
ncbi:MAG: hypothetical protein JRH20_25835 [Deltaproteobacteria bacterium]|nr:hypothetical protein [Deltaproteobacteria bacterium]